jgi:magnesium-protoporphyrin O-methyltransferase
VVCSCCGFESAADRQFTAVKAAKELEAYRKGRLGPTTRLLRDAVVDAGLNHGSLLDIGGGVGALAFELLDRGMSSAIVADAAAAYVAAATEEATRRGTRARIVQGDFLQMSDTLPSVDLVSLDRVVCCYPLYEPLLQQALEHAGSGFALSYPRDRWYVRAGMWFENAKRARKSGFRTFVHPAARMQEIVRQAGFVLARRRFTFVWTIDVYLRDTASRARSTSAESGITSA